MKLYGFIKKGKGIWGDILSKITGNDILVIQSATTTHEIENTGADNKNPYISAKDIIQQGADGILSKGTFTWNQDYNFTATKYFWLKRGVTYSNNITDITLDPSHATKNRVDTIVLTFDSLGNGIIKVLKGDEYVGLGVAKIPNPETELFLTTINVDANTTEPSQVNDDILYDEDESVVYPNTANVVGDASGAASGIKCIGVTDFTTGQSFFVKKAVDFNPKDSKDFLFQIYPTSGRWENNGTIRIALINNANEVISNYVIIDSRLINKASNPISFDSFKLVWQGISIPMDLFNPTSEIARGVVILKDDNRGTDSFKMDVLRFQSGITETPTEFTVTSKKDPFVATQGQTEFVLSSTPDNVDVDKNRVIQIETIDYTLVGDKVTTTIGCNAGDVINVRKFF